MSAESQLLVFSKSGIQRELTSPHNPRALYYNPSVVVGYVAGAPVIEVASHDPQQGTIFYTLDQGVTDAPQFVRGNVCLTCHISASTLDVPGPIDRSNRVGEDGRLLQRAGPSVTVNHADAAHATVGRLVRHQQRQHAAVPAARTPRQPDRGRVRRRRRIRPSCRTTPWSAGSTALPESRGYLSPSSDLAALLVFDHQVHAMNLLTRLNWEWRVATAEGRARVDADGIPPAPRRAGRLPAVRRRSHAGGRGDAAARVRRQLLAAAPADRYGRSVAQLDLTTRLMRYPVSYMIYTEAFDGLASEVKDRGLRAAVHAAGRPRSRPALRPPADAAGPGGREILRDTKADLPPRFRPRRTAARRTRELRIATDAARLATAVSDGA